MVQFLPLTEGTFFQKSKGYATMFLMQACLSIDCLQSSVTAICQIVYLGESSDTSGPTTTSQAKFMFIANIMISLVGVAMGVILLVLKQSVLDNSSSSGSSSDDKLDVDKEGDEEEEAGAQQQSADVELAVVYRKSSTSFILEDGSGGMVTFNNPMHENAAAAASPGGQLQSSVLDLARPPQLVVEEKEKEKEEEDDRVNRLMAEVSRLAQENEGLRRRLVLAVPTAASVLDTIPPNTHPLNNEGSL
jgi:hypothetical protein